MAKLNGFTKYFLAQPKIQKSGFEFRKTFSHIFSENSDFAYFHRKSSKNGKTRGFLGISDLEIAFFPDLPRRSFLDGNSPSSSSGHLLL